MKLAFGTHTLLLHGRDEGISDPQTWKESYNSLLLHIISAIFGVEMPTLHESLSTSRPCT